MSSEYRQGVSSMSEPKKPAYQPLRPDDPIEGQGLLKFLVSLLKGSNQPTPPPGPLPEQQIDLLGNHFKQQIFNNPEEVSYFTEQTTQPYGRLGRMLTDEERLALLKMLMR